MKKGELLEELKKNLPFEAKNLDFLDLLTQKIENLIEFCLLFQIPAAAFELDMSLLFENYSNYRTGLIFAVFPLYFLYIFSKTKPNK